MQTVLVTGATGALGRAVARRLRQQGQCRVVAASRHCDDELGLRLDIRGREISQLDSPIRLVLAGSAAEYGVVQPQENPIRIWRLRAFRSGCSLAGRSSAIELGPLSAIRDYFSTNDATTQILAIATYAEPGCVYHVACGVPITVRDLLYRYLARYKLDAAMVREAAELSDRDGYDAPAIYADVTSTHQLMRTSREWLEA